MQGNGRSSMPPDPGSTGLGNGEPTAAPLRLGAVLARLEEIRRDLDRDDLDLEDQLLLYREGCTLAAQAKRILDTTRAEVEILMQDGDASSAEALQG